MTPPEPLLITLGYGKRSIDDAIALLHEHEVGYLVDVRSVPWSKYRPEFTQNALKERLRAEEIGYLHLGEELGGRPRDPTCYDAAGKVLYEACRERPAYGEGIGRLRTAWDQRLRVALLCSEARPEQCHRAKLLGPSLVAAGIDVMHVDEDGTLLNQDEVMARLEGGQPSLFGEVITKKTAKSVHRYRPEEE